MIKPLLMSALVAFCVGLLEAKHNAHASQNEQKHHGDHKGEKGHDDHDDHDDEKHLSESEHVRVLHAWTRAGGAGVIQIFMEIENISDDIIMIKSANIGDTIFALAGLQMKDGEPVYTPIGQVPVQPGRELVLAPNGLVFQGNWDEDLHVGDELDITLAVGDLLLDVHVVVEAKDANQHGHAGHNH